MCDAEFPEISSETFPKARKVHRCCECRGTIQPGERYSCLSGLWDGRFEVYKTCLECIELRRDVRALMHKSPYDGGPALGHMYEDIFEGRESNLELVTRFMRREGRETRHHPALSGWKNWNNNYEPNMAKKPTTELSLPVISRKTPAPKPTQKELLDAMVQRTMEENARQREEAQKVHNATRLPLIELALAKAIGAAQALQREIEQAKLDGKTDLEIHDLLEALEDDEGAIDNGDFQLCYSPGYEHLVDFKYRLSRETAKATGKPAFERFEKTYKAIPDAKYEHWVRRDIKNALEAQRRPERLLEDPAAREAIDQALGALGIIKVQKLIEA